MKSEPPARVVFDTNSLVSGYLFPQSVPGQALNLAIRRYQLLMSMEVAAELTEVMRREIRRFLSHEYREELVANTIRDSKFIDTSTQVASCCDPDDNKVLELALMGRR